MKLYTYFLSFFFFYVFTISNINICVAEETDIDRLIQQGILENKDLYSYNHLGRTDPFKPFVSPVAISVTEQDPNEIIENNQELTGMQVFEPGQLTLVGVLLTPSNELAFVEDQAKKGYVLKIGTPIGKRGVVTKIEIDKVHIQETAKTRSGQEIKNVVFMSLNKDGDR